MKQKMGALQSEMQRNMLKYHALLMYLFLVQALLYSMARISNTKLEKLEPQYSIFHNVSNICVTLYELISIHMSFFNLKYMMPIWYEFSTATAARKMFFCKFLVTNEVENKYGML